MKKITLLLSQLLFSYCLMAQTGALSGNVYDAGNGDPLIGATVKILNNASGAVTDIDGKYLITGLDAGRYDVQVSYIGYTPVTITGIEIKAGQTTLQDFSAAEESGVAIEAVVIEAKSDKATENSLLTLQKKSAVVMDGISAQQFSRMGDGDAGAAVRRVTGVSVEGGRYVYVRGLGDRYSKTMVNSAEVPGLDPNRNSVQLDLFPSSLLDNINVLKTFSADMPGDFTGGCVMINTKEFPDKFTLNASASYGYNTNATFNSRFLSQPSGGLDWLGLDNGSRALPAAVQGDLPTNAYANPQLTDQIVRSFDNRMTVGQKSPFLNQGYNFSIGNRFNLGEKQLGVIFALTYNNENEFYENGVYNRYVLATAASGQMTPYMLLSDTEAKNNVLLGGILNTAFKINDNHKISLNLMRNQSGTASARYLEGVTPFNNDSTVRQLSHVMRYIQRSMNMAQLKGEHYFPNARKLRFEWQSTFTYSTQDEPDFRSLTANKTDINGEIYYAINPANYKKPSRFFRNLDEINSDNKVFISLPYQFNGREAKFKTGLSFLSKNRTFRERRLDYEVINSLPVVSNVEQYFASENLGLLGYNPNGQANLGTYIIDASEDRNQFDGNQMVGSAYVMTDIPLNSFLKLNAGVRTEYTQIVVSSQDVHLPDGKISKIDVLPGVNLVAELRENMNLRLSYSRTVARPTFREMAPFSSFDFNTDFILVGNPQLNRALSDNADLRWEYFNAPGEIISASLFFKNIQNPIERVFVPQAYDQVTFRNVNRALVFGAELEVRKKLGFIAPALEDLSVGVNFSYIASRVDIDPQELQRWRDVLGEDYPATRRMFAQSPYLLNAVLGYVNAKSGTEANLNFNIFGARLTTVGTGTLPNLYEQPRPTLNLMFAQSMGAAKRFKLTLRANNLLNPAYNFSANVGGNDYSFQKYSVGRDFSVGLSYTIK